jgi:hypothetical protein
MDRAGLLHEVIASAIRIDQGRKWLKSDGLESNGRVAYERGLVNAMDSFQLAQTFAVNDLETLILTEQAFIMQELQFCDSADTQAKGSLEKATKSFDDALRSLEAVNDFAGYKIAEKTHPTDGKYRYKNMPKDSFHIACVAHKTRVVTLTGLCHFHQVERVEHIQHDMRVTFCCIRVD